MKRALSAALAAALFAACAGTHPIAPPPPARPAPSARPAEPPPANLTATTGFGCEHDCQGSVDAALSAALRERALAARRCYETALKRDASLRGKVVLGLQLSDDGSVCASRIVQDTLKNPDAVGCIQNLFLGARFPAPGGGCVNVALPLVFTVGDAGAPPDAAPPDSGAPGSDAASPQPAQP